MQALPPANRADIFAWQDPDAHARYLAFRSVRALIRLPPLPTADEAFGISSSGMLSVSSEHSGCDASEFMEADIEAGVCSATSASSADQAASGPEDSPPVGGWPGPRSRCVQQGNDLEEMSGPPPGPAAALARVLDPRFSTELPRHSIKLMAVAAGSDAPAGSVESVISLDTEVVACRLLLPRECGALELAYLGTDSPPESEFASAAQAAAEASGIEPQRPRLGESPGRSSNCEGPPSLTAAPGHDRQDGSLVVEAFDEEAATAERVRS